MVIFIIVFFYQLLTFFSFLRLNFESYYIFQSFIMFEFFIFDFVLR